METHAKKYKDLQSTENWMDWDLVFGYGKLLFSSDVLIISVEYAISLAISYWIELNKWLNASINQ